MMKTVGPALNLRESFTHLFGRYRKVLVRSSEEKQGQTVKKHSGGFWLVVFMNGLIMSHQE